MNRQRGFSIIAIAFILTVLAGLGVVIAQLGTTQHLGSAFANEGRQGWYAARAGLEVGRHRFAADGTCAASTSLSFEGFNIILTCSSPPDPVIEGTDVYSVATLESTAVSGAGTAYEVRRVARLFIWRDQGMTP